jgi:hypothetical protein
MHAASHPFRVLVVGLVVRAVGLALIVPALLVASAALFFS